MKVLITGATGLVGSRVVKLLKPDFEFLTPGSDELDITHAEPTRKYLDRQEFDLVLHLAAYTSVGKAETERELCRQINVEGTRNLLAAAKSKPFIFISTDFVFDGQSEVYNEDSIPSPRSYYGQTKFKAEQIVKNQAMIVRISYPYGNSQAPKKDFVKGIKAKLRAGETVLGIKDSVFTPTLIDDIAFGLKELINNFKPALYHLVGSESLSPYEAFRKIAQVFNLNQNLIEPTSYADYFHGDNKRPKKSAIISKYNFVKMHSFSEGLNLVKEQLA